MKRFGLIGMGVVLGIIAGVYGSREIRERKAAPAPMEHGQHAVEAPATQPAATQPAESPPHTKARILHLTPERVQKIGVVTTPVKRTTAPTTIRTVGNVIEDERRIHHVHTKFPGWVEELFVDFVGKQVNKGAPLLTIYSPELVSTQEEYLLALRARRELPHDAAPAADMEALVENARQRLLLWDIPEAEIQSLEKEGKPRKALTLYAPMSGFVTHLNAIHGMYVTPGTELFMITDYSHVWVLADLYESDIALVKPGQHALLSVDAYPEETFQGEVAYIYPTMETETRTVKARFDFPNPDLKLKPGMFARVTLTLPGRDQLVVPADAVIDSGDATYVFVDKGGGRYAQRSVHVGRRTQNGEVVILHGLADGDMVVSRAAFLLDSESRLRHAPAGGGGHQH